MKKYFSTFITGTQEIIKEFLLKRGIKIILILDGLVVYQTDYPEKETRKFHIFNNTYLLLQFFTNLTPNIKSLEKILSFIAHDRDLLRKIMINIPPNRRNFRIITSLENRMVRVSRSLLKTLEAVILKIDNMKLNVKSPDLEFWILLRKEGYGFFGIRITYPSREESHREKGKLRKEIAYIMNFISEPKPEDIILDPFAGYGSIPLERAKNFPYKEIIAVDKDKDLIFKLKQKIMRLKIKMTIIHGDALSLNKISDNSIDKIVTDPPWGEYERISDLEKFYEAMLREFNRLLKPTGIIVLLVGAKEIFENVLITKFANTFLVKRKYNILVSGKKAAIYKLIKTIENNDK
jgi:16S rRNA G966 N2-methylase RsmD